MQVKKFPEYKAGHVFNKFKGKIRNNCSISSKLIEINYPCRLDAMAINPAAVCYNDSMVFTPGEVVVKPKIFINVKVELKSETGGKLEITERTKRKVLVKHAYLLMCKALNVSPSLVIDVNDDNIPKHCGFGSSSSTIASVASAINELYSNPIDRCDLIKYLASNHGEEISNDNNDYLKMVQCIGGGATGGLTDAGIIIISGQSTSIAQMNYDGKIIIGIPKDFAEKDALELMELEEKNLWKFEKTGNEYAKTIAYDLLHKALPEMKNGNISSLADVVFDYRFNMGSIENCSFVYDKMVEQANILRKLYEDGNCSFLALSSVGPAYFAIIRDSKNVNVCKKIFEKAGMNIIETSICNDSYIIVNKENVTNNDFWNEANTVEQFRDRPVSSYITNELDGLIKNKVLNILDVGCGGGRYSKYLVDKNQKVIGIDNSLKMVESLKQMDIPSIEASFVSIPLFDSCADLILSTGVLHNARTEKELESGIKEISRLLKNNSYCIISIFTNDVITDDLIYKGNDIYEVINRPPMVLKNKEEIVEIFAKYDLKFIKEIDNHITDVGSGKRNVYSILLKKVIK